ncbi:hypothetical protein C5E44_13505 [Nocardia nova]|uniref:hypothetical protein n=1 Tax=Nocardia nova TaxID=37330 RepID=UPI000CE9E3E3|nr:hypothetical protein C5E44_13505 [Nocardia nova]
MNTALVHLLTDHPDVLTALTVAVAILVVTLAVLVVAAVIGPTPGWGERALHVLTLLLAALTRKDR